MAGSCNSAMKVLRLPVQSLASLGGIASSKGGQERQITLYYHRNDSTHKQPTVIYVPGFMSLGRATKSQFMASHCQSKGYDYVCYDPEGVVDLSKPGTPEDQVALENFESLKFSHWFDDCFTAVQTVKEARPNDPVLLVGSSMGGWISSKIATKCPETIKALLLIAPSINFMKAKYRLLYQSCGSDQQKQLEEGGTIITKTPYGYMPVSERFAKESVEVEIDTSKALDITCPVKILHGMDDDVVPFESGVSLAKLMSSSDVDVTLRKSGDHRMSKEEDLALIGEMLDKLCLKLRS